MILGILIIPYLRVKKIGLKLINFTFTLKRKFFLLFRKNKEYKIKHKSNQNLRNEERISFTIECNKLKKLKKCIIFYFLSSIRPYNDINQ